MQQLPLTHTLVDLPGRSKLPDIPAMAGDVPDDPSSVSFADILEAVTVTQDNNAPVDPEMAGETDPQDLPEAEGEAADTDDVEVLMPDVPTTDSDVPGDDVLSGAPALPAHASPPSAQERPELPSAPSDTLQSVGIRSLPPSAQPPEVPVLPSFPSEGRPNAPIMKGYPAMPDTASAATRLEVGLPAAARPDTKPGFSIGHPHSDVKSPVPPGYPGVAPEGRTPLPVPDHAVPVVHTENQAIPASTRSATLRAFSNADTAAPVAGETRAQYTASVKTEAANDIPKHPVPEFPESNKPQNAPSVAGLIPGRGETVSSTASVTKGPPSGIPVPPQAVGAARKLAPTPPDHPVKQAEARSTARPKPVDAPPAPAFGTPSSSPPAAPQMMPESRPSFVVLPPKADAIAERLSGESLPVSDLRFHSETGGPRAASDTAPPRAELPRHIAMQLAEAVQRGGPGRPTDFVMNPVELGRVKINLLTTDGTVVVQVSAERPETLDLMRRHADMLAQEFLSIGYGEARFSFSHQGSGNASPDTHANHNSHHPGSPENEPLSNANETSNLPTTITDRVDIRV